MITIDGLDYTGKTTCARLLEEKLNIPYTKIRKGSLFDYSNCRNEFEITEKIIEEINSSITSDNVILDRSYLSAIATGKIYSPSIDSEKLIQGVPKKLLHPDRGVIVTTTLKNAQTRSKVRATKQDIRVLNGSYSQVQEWLVKQGRDKGYLIINNDFSSVQELSSGLDKLIERFL